MYPPIVGTIWLNSRRYRGAVRSASHSRSQCSLQFKN